MSSARQTIGHADEGDGPSFQLSLGTPGPWILATRLLKPPRFASRATPHRDTLEPPHARRARQLPPVGEQIWRGDWAIGVCGEGNSTSR